MKKTITFFPTQAAKMLLATLLLTLTAQTARAAGDIYVGYLDPTAPIGQQRKTVLNPVCVNENTTEMGTADETTWYYVRDNVTNDHRIEVKGTVNLILTDGCNFTVSKGIHVPSSSALNIYAQSVANRGSLTANNYALTYYAAIGGNGGEDAYGATATNGEDAGDITIYGGNITITNGNIGGGDGGNGNAWTNIYFDEFENEYSESSAGNGGNGGDGNVTIYSGNVRVNGNIGGGKAGTGQDENGGKDESYNGYNGGGTVNLSWANTSDGIYADCYYGYVTLLKAFYDSDARVVFDAGVVNDNDLLNRQNLMYAGDYYAVTIGSMPDGVTATADLELSAGVKNAVVGQVVTISFSGVPDGKVPVVSVTYGANNDNVNDIIDNGDGTFSFVMPNGTVTVTASDLIEKIPYILEDGTTAYCTNYTVLDGTKTSLASGTYVVNSDVTVDSRIDLTGDTNLILGDGYTLNVKGIYIPQGSTLTIYAQSDGVTAGKIVSNPTSGAAIGGKSGSDNGNIVIHGGRIEAAGGEHCAGIGSNDDQTGGSITIYGGTVTAKGGSDGAAIGGGNGGSGGTIDIYGGVITANGPDDSDTCENGAGIGGGDCGAGGTITIYGGTITTYSRDGAGIGGGDEGDGGTITIYGGTITSNKVNQGQGARIGGGYDAAPGTIIINGGTITTNGGTGAGIGGGKRNTAKGTVTINGGIINASGDYGIGAGEGGADVAIILGWMKATDQIYASSYNGTVTIAGGQAFINDASTPEIVSGTDIGKALVDGKTLKPHWTGSGDSESDPYMINRPGELDLLATNVNAGTDYSGKYFKLGADIAYSHTTDWNNAESTENNYTPIGGYFSSSCPFCGTFDGQGHTISGIRIYKGGQTPHVDGNLGLFGFVQSGTVKNITVSDMRITGYALVGGIVGWNEQYSRVENCHATATVALNAVQDEADSFGGIVGYSLMNSAIIGCSSSVTITTSGTLTDCKDFGGIVGSTDDGCSVKNCLAMGVTIPDISFTHSQNDITASGAIAGCFSGDALSHNYYSGCTLGGTLTESGIGAGRDDNGNSNSNERHDVTDNNGAVPTTLHTLTLGEDITASGVLINQSGTISVASGSTVVLSYSGSLDANQIAVFSLGSTALSGNSFTMPAADAQVSVSTATVWGIDGGADGSEGNPYVITRCAELDLLSQRVNSRTGDDDAASGYSGKYFVLANDIAYDPNGIDANGENYTAIGISSHSFKGIFDGQGHTISGIRIYKGGQTPKVDGNLGLFGYVNNGTVRNVTLADASITGYDNIGGIAGNSSYGTIENCLVIGTSIRATHNINGSGGAIVGNNFSGTTLSHNYYSDCIRNISSSDIGTKNGDYSINDGAVRAFILSESAAVPSMNENDKVVFRRKFTQGVASTVCLPFSMTSITGGKVYQFVGVEYDNTDGWVATMQEADPTAEPPVTGNEATALAANTPYLFMPAATGPVLFYGTAPASVSAGTTTSGDWTFYGTYSRLTYETTESNSNPFSGKVFGFATYATEAGANNNASQEAVEAGEFVRATTGAYIPAFRAFLKYAGSEESLQARGTRSGKTVVPEYITVRLIGKNGDVDAIGEISLSTGEVTFDSNAWYDLNGHRLAEKPTQRGIYINNGRKVAIK